MDAEVTASHASWQLAMGERHGGMFGTVWQAIITEHQCSNRRDVKLACDAALIAKNTTVTRNGHNAYQAGLGHEPRDPSSAIADNDNTGLSSKQVLGPQSEIGRAASMCHTSKMAILKLDTSDKLRRAISRGPPDNRSHQHEYLPGSRVYFWEPCYKRATAPRSRKVERPRFNHTAGKTPKIFCILAWTFATTRCRKHSSCVV